MNESARLGVPLEKNYLTHSYVPGDSDTRPWGNYKVTKTGVNESGEEYCEKIILVNPGKILSLQSHEYRREYWKVLEGVLDVVLGGKTIRLQAGEGIAIPLGAIHCMANTQLFPCAVHERQEGICREDDIKRYADAYGREKRENSLSFDIIASLNAYDALLGEISGDGASNRAGA